jgi:glutamyl-tRNA reductase
MPHTVHSQTLTTLGINHQTAPVDIREQVAFPPERLIQALKGLRETGLAHGCAILSTCNRSEIYFTHRHADIQPLQNWLHQFFDLTYGTLTPYIYAYNGRDAVLHINRVASGLNSLVLGEPQILGQMKDAYAFSREANTLNGLLDRLFQHVFNTAKLVRTETAIGSNPVSVAFAAVTLARQIFGDLKEQNVLLIGAGQTIELAARHLREQGVKQITIANRTLANASLLAQEVNGYAINLADLPHHLHEADIVISSTASTLPILGKGAVESALKKRRNKPMLLVDIAVPRDIEAEVAKLDNVYLYTVDDLVGIVEENRRNRAQAAQEAEDIVQLKTDHFMQQWRLLSDAAPLIRDYRHFAEQQRDEVLAHALRELHAGHDNEAVLRKLAHQLTNKLTHTPCLAIREAGNNGGDHLLQNARSLLLPENLST